MKRAHKEIILENAAKLSEVERGYGMQLCFFVESGFVKMKDYGNGLGAANWSVIFRCGVCGHPCAYQEMDRHFHEHIHKSDLLAEESV